MDTAIARVASRMRQGGHDIPEKVIRRRFAAGLRNLEQAYKAAVDSWAVYDNGAMNPSLSIGVIPMNNKDISTAKDPDLRSSLAALQRAALLARQTAIQTNTNIVVVQDGQLVFIDAATLRQQNAEHES